MKLRLMLRGEDVDDQRGRHTAVAVEVEDEDEGW